MSDASKESDWGSEDWGGGVIKGGLVYNTFGDALSQIVFATVGISVEVVAKNDEEIYKSRADFCANEYNLADSDAVGRPPTPRLCWIVLAACKE